MRVRNARGLLAANLASGTGLVALGALVHGGRTRRFDNRVRGYFPRYRRSRTKRATETAGPIGKTWLQLVVTGGVAGYLLVRGKGVDSATSVILSSLAASGASNAAEKFLPRRQAPWGRLSIAEPSFPSGHALRASTVALVTAYVLLRENEAYREFAIPAALSVPVITALHALYLDRHWATDIIGGWLGGLALGSGCAYGYELAQSRKDHRRNTGHAARNAGARG